ncbi:MAG TPA: PAS domain S-box protein, partial [Anaerolineales bacterium]|nr:PAS domain S-box protein [Anaerolineales bacterium]
EAGGDGFGLLFRSHPIPMWIYDLETLAFLEVNNAAVEKYGYSRGEFLALAIKDIRPAEDVPRLLENTGGTRPPLQHSGKWRHRLKNGEVIDVEITSHTIEFNGRKCALVMAQDITEQRKVEQALLESESMYRDLVESSQHLICTHDLEGNLLSVNEAAVKLTGYSRKDLLGMNLRDALVSPSLEGFDIYLARIGKRGRAHGEMHIRTANGEARIWEYYNTLKTDGVETPIVRGTARDITEQKQVEEALQASEKRFRALIQNGLDNISLLAADGTLLWESPAVVSILNYEPDQFVGRNMFDLMHPDDVGWTSEAFQKLLQEPGSSRHESFRLKSRIGEWRWVEAIFTNMLNEPHIEAVVVNYRDITDRRRAEEARKEAEIYYRSLFEQMHDGIFIMSLDGRIMNANQRAADMLGYTIEELRELSIFEASMQPEASREVTRRLFEGEHIPPFERALRRKDGSPLFVEVNVELVKDDDGQPFYIQSVARDITERKQAQDALRASEERFRSYIENANDYIFTLDHNGRITSANQAMCEKLGYELSELLGRSAVELIAPERRMDAVSTLQKIWAGETVAEFETSIQTRDGKTYIVQIRGRALHQEGEKFESLHIARDITERKRAEDALYKSEDLFRKAFQYSAIGMALVSIDGKWLKVNSRLCSMLGYSEKALLKKTFQDITHPGDLKADLNYVRQMLAGELETYTMEKRYIHKNGGVVWVLLAVSLVKNDDGTPLHFISQIKDITERKRAAEELRKSEGRYRSIAEDMPALVCRFKPDGVLTFLNSFYSDYLDLPADELLGRNLFDLIPDPEKELVRKKLYALDHQTPFITYEYKTLNVRGEECWQRWTDRALFDEQGEVVEYQSVGEDITERKQAEQALREAEAKYRSLVENLPAILYLDEPDEVGTSHYFSPQVESLLGYPPSAYELDPHLWHSQVYPQDYERAVDTIQRTLTEGESTEEYRMVAADGRVVWVRDTNTLLRDGEGKPQFIQGFIENITERKLAEEKLRRNEEILRLFVENSPAAIA